MDDESVRSPTNSELKTFRVLANLDFTDFGKDEMKKAEKPVEKPDWGGEDFVRSREATPERGGPVPERQKTPERVDDRENELKSRDDENDAPSDAPNDGPRDTTGHEYREEERHEEKSEDASPEYKKAKEEAEADIALEKEALLYELELMDKQGVIKLHRHLSMSDSLEAIQYQYDRANMIASTNQTVDWAKMGIKMGSGVLENVLKQFGLTMVDGFSKNLCQDMNKFNKPLTKMYRKYWRRGTSSPEMELAMIVFGALAMTVITNKGFLGGSAKPKAAPTEPFARPTPPESALRPPNIMQTSAPMPQVATPASSIPDWARAALAAPAPAAPAHFAQQKVPDTWPEMSRPLQIPPIAAPVSAMARPAAQATAQVAAQMAAQVAAQVAPPPTYSIPAAPTAPAAPSAPAAPPETESATRIINIASPKSTRRRKEPTTELNLDTM